VVPPAPSGPATGHLSLDDDPGPVVERFDEQCVEAVGFVMNVTRVWARLPGEHDRLFELLDDVARVAKLSFRQRGILVTACAATRGDSYCALAWGRKLAAHSGDDVAVSMLRGTDDALDAPDRALAAWARHVADDPNMTTSDDVDALREAGFDDTQILAITVFIGLRVAFSTVNASLGIQPDHEFDDASPVRAAVNFGRRIAT
jgi:uncharacterized peroxidase-related enzyme